MGEIRAFLLSVIRHPVSFSILVLCVVILIVWYDYKSTQSPASSVVASEQSQLAQNDNSVAAQTIQLAPPGSQPNIMDKVGTNGNRQTGAPAIDALVGRLEEKVKADPSNLDNRILLAQTYKELGRSDDAMRELRNILQQEPDNSRANLVLASILSQSSDPDQLEESLKLLTKIQDDTSIQPYLVHMYRGDALIRQQNHQGALQSWKQALDSMPKSEPRYVTLEKKVMDLTNGVSAITPPNS